MPMSEVTLEAHYFSMSSNLAPLPRMPLFSLETHSLPYSTPITKAAGNKALQYGDLIFSSLAAHVCKPIHYHLYSTHIALNRCLNHLTFYPLQPYFLLPFRRFRTRRPSKGFHLHASNCSFVSSYDMLLFHNFQRSLCFFQFQALHL